MKARILRTTCGCALCETDPWLAIIHPDRFPGTLRFSETFPTHAQALAWALEMLETLSTTKEVTK